MNVRNFIKNYPVTIYFIMTYLVSWLGAIIVAAPRLIHGESLRQKDGLIMFPVMLLGPFLSGIALTAVLEGKTGISNLFSKMGRWKIQLKWYASLFIPPVIMGGLLLILGKILSPVFSPGFFSIGFLFGIPAGFLEETGWTGFAFPLMRKRFNSLTASIMLGSLWGLWHLPVISFLGTATPHGTFWLPYFFAFIIAMTA